MIMFCLCFYYHGDGADSGRREGAHIPIAFSQPALLPDLSAEWCWNEMLKTSHAAVHGEIKTQFWKYNNLPLQYIWEQNLKQALLY